jgi:branched-chain amino acid transport system permease protein
VLSLLGLRAFPVVFLGGLGSFPGVIVGGVIIGIAESLVAAYVSSELVIMTPFIVLILLLFIRPQGLFGEKPVERI